MQEKKELSIEFVALKQNYIELSQDFEQQKEEQEEINVQLINLINANKTLEEQNAKLNEKQDILQQTQNEFNDTKTSMESKIKELETQLTDLKSEHELQSVEVNKTQNNT